MIEEETKYSYGHVVIIIISDAKSLIVIIEGNFEHIIFCDPLFRAP